MSNFSAFDPKHLQKLLEPFAPGMAAHITPIKYEALSPDYFLFLFRTTGQDNDEHFFVSLETDHIGTLDNATCDIETWHGKVIRFWPLHGTQDNADESNVKDFQVPTGGPYLTMLAEVERPTSKGYWSEAVKIMPGDNIGEKIATFTGTQQTEIRNILAKILEHKVDPNMPFFESMQTKHKDTIVDDVNQTDIAVSLYVRPDGGIEYFYNYVTPTIGGKDYKKPRD